MEKNGTGWLLFVSGPSGVGKSTICNRLAGDLPAQFALSATTRQGKPQDQWGKKYIFINENEFKKRIANNEFLEYAQVFGHWYGTLRQPVLDALADGRTVLLEIDIQGGIQIAKMFPAAIGIFILPPSEEELIRRLRERGRDAPEVIATRLRQAQREIALAEQCGVYRIQVVNRTLDQTITELIGFVKNLQSHA
ncbi:MAG: guanylate kinase [Planctomycetes bacterium]|jgi:guanylate kinase|nr:guanylate kinase [Planctomycetota bacterium]